MIAVDTNLVVRYLVGDDARQTAQACALIDGEQVFVPKTVLLETGWVLRSSHGMSGADIAVVLRAFAGLPNVAIEDSRVVLRALAWVNDGLEFADALHLASAVQCDAFVTFDKDFVRAAKALPSQIVRHPT